MSLAEPRDERGVQLRVQPSSENRFIPWFRSFEVREDLWRGALIALEIAWIAFLVAAVVWLFKL